jgi:hypothetical protein
VEEISFQGLKPDVTIVDGKHRKIKGVIEIKKPYDYEEFAGRIAEINLKETLRGEKRRNVFLEFKFVEDEMIFDNKKMLGQVFDYAKHLRNYSNIAGVFVMVSTFLRAAVYWFPDSEGMAVARNLGELKSARLPSMNEKNCACVMTREEQMEMILSGGTEEEIKHVIGCRRGMIGGRKLCRSVIYNHQSKEFMWFLASVLGKMLFSEELCVSEESVRCLIENNVESFTWTRVKLSDYYSDNGMSHEWIPGVNTKKPERFLTLSWINEQVCEMSPVSKAKVFVTKNYSVIMDRSSCVEEESWDMAKSELGKWTLGYGEGSARVMRIGGKTVLAMPRLQCLVLENVISDVERGKIVNEIRRFAAKGLFHRALSKDHIAFNGSGNAVFLSMRHVEIVPEHQIDVNVENIFAMMMEQVVGL